MNLRRLFAFAAGTLAGVALSWLLVGLASSRDSRPARPVSAPLSAGLGAAEPMPAVVRGRIVGNVPRIGRLGLRFGLAQHERTASGAGIWLVEGRRVDCVFLQARPAPASACVPDSSARRNGIALGSYTTAARHPGVPVSFLVAGVVPAGVTAVSLAVGRRVEMVPVRHRVWAERARSPVEVRALVR